MRKPLDISALVSYNKTTKTAYLRRIFYTNVVMLPLGSNAVRCAGSSPERDKARFHSHQYKSSIIREFVLDLKNYKTNFKE